MSQVMAIEMRQRVNGLRVALVGAALLLLFAAGLRAQDFIRGDADASGEVDLADSMFTLDCVFAGAECPSCEDAADANDDGEMGVSDAVYGLLFLFAGGAAPPAQYPECGSDPTSSSSAHASVSGTTSGSRRRGPPWRRRGPPSAPG